MRKLNKKQSKIIADVKSSIDVNIVSMQDFQNQGRYEMVSHCQDALRNELHGISHYIIHSEIKLWDARLKNAFDQIMKMHELSSEYRYESFDNDTFISEKDFEKYGTSATA